jgi:hypothetical protein
MILSKSTTAATLCYPVKETHPSLLAPLLATFPSKSCARAVSSGLLFSPFLARLALQHQHMAFRFPPEGSDIPFTLTSSTSMVLILFRSDISVRSNGFSATLAPRSSGDYGPFPNPPEPRSSDNTINVGPDGKPSNPPYPFDVSGDQHALPHLSRE